ncbi:MAG TPA: GNAT family N-acetyltransferase [Nocardioides sp.]|nr:GNAT family N-acetyltransferase [Nocardioides sp.]
MDIPSLAFRTDLALARLAGSEVEDHGEYVAVRTQDNPGYYWGNYLLLPHAPSAEELPAWEETFVRTFPQCRHRAYGVATAGGAREDLAAFAAAGLEVDASSVMTATEVHAPPRPNRDATYRPLADDDDWDQQVELWLASTEEGATRDFVVAKVAAERRMVEAGQGAWWGAFDGGRLLSSMGLFAASPGLARFQQVQTHPDARGRGLAGTLVHRVSRYGFDELGAHTLVMVADPDYLAIRIYRSVGFEDTETQLQAQRRPPA